MNPPSLLVKISMPSLLSPVFLTPLTVNLYFQGVPQLPCAKALYNYDGKEPGDLKFSKGDIIILRRQVDENWYHGEMGGVHGFFPTNFVQVIKPLPQPPPQCKALYDFELKDKEADKDCLPFSKVRLQHPQLCCGHYSKTKILLITVTHYLLSIHFLKLYVCVRM